MTDTPVPRVRHPATTAHPRPVHRPPGTALRGPVVAMACLLALLAPLAAPAADLGADLDGLLAHARAHSPELAAMRHEADASSQRIEPAGALPDPVLRVELENFNNYASGNAASLLPGKVGDTRWTLMQPLPGWGKRGLRRDAAEADAQQARARSEAAWTELAARLKAAYAQHHALGSVTRLTQEMVDLMGRLEQLAQARYAGGLASQQDAIRAQLELTALRSELIALDSDRRQVRTRLNALLDRPPGAPLADPLVARPLPPPERFDAEALAAQLRGANPALAAELAKLRAAEANRSLTERNRYPDATVGIAPVQVGSRLTTWTLMVEVGLPLPRESRRAQEREAEAMVEAQRARQQALARQLEGELGDHLAALDAARRGSALIASRLLPQSELNFRSALAAYEAGKVDFATVLDAQRQIRKARQDQVRADADAQMHLAEVERIVGGEL